MYRKYLSLLLLVLFSLTLFAEDVEYEEAENDFSFGVEMGGLLPVSTGTDYWKSFKISTIDELPSRNVVLKAMYNLNATYSYGLKIGYASCALKEGAYNKTLTPLYHNNLILGKWQSEAKYTVLSITPMVRMQGDETPFFAEIGAGYYRIYQKILSKNFASVPTVNGQDDVEKRLDGGLYNVDTMENKFGLNIGYGFHYNRLELISTYHVVFTHEETSRFVTINLGYLF